MRASGTPPVYIAGRGQDGGLQLHRGVVQPHPAPFWHPLSIPNRLRDADAQGNPNDLSDKPSTEPGQLHLAPKPFTEADLCSGQRRGAAAWLSTQLGMFSNCGRSSGFAHLRRRSVNISSIGAMPSGLSRLPSVTKIIPGKPSRLLVNTLAPHCGQKFRSTPLPDLAM